MRDFQAIIKPAQGTGLRQLPPLDVPRNDWQPKRVIAIDGSTVTTPLRFGLPSADASLLKVSIVLIDLKRLRSVPPDGIPSPALFREMEAVETIDKAIPGANVLDRLGVNNTPAEFFRESVYRILAHRIDPLGESLGETLAVLMEGHDISRTKCPVEDCEQRLHAGVGEYRCHCPKRERLFESDALRFVERFNPAGTNGEAHGEVRHLIEVLSLLNILRFFASEERVMHLRDVVFVLDGPLAMFGHAAWLAPAIRRELVRINKLCRRRGFDLAVFGFEKSGQFVEHFEHLDFCDTNGPRRKLTSRTVLAPDAEYINAHITFRPPDAKPHGKDTYFGRKILYKTKTNDHAVITVAMVNDAAQDFSRAELVCYPRLGDCLNVLDELSTYLYHDGFVPLIRAHSQAAKLLLTSPPYCDVTNYRSDNWIRLWVLGEGALPDWESSQRYGDRNAYRKMLLKTFSAARDTLAGDAVILVRTDTRQFTRDATAATLRHLWPEHRMLAKSDVPVRSQTILFGDRSAKPGETDFLLLPPGDRRRPRGMRVVPVDEMSSVEVWDDDLAPTEMVRNAS